jgi:DNA-binding transcriptional LysR family regulator
MHIRQIDLNLVAVFDAIVAEGSLSAAGKRLGMSQSAVSHALARLRSLTGDELFVRTSHGVRPTKRALALSGPLRSAIDLVQIALSSGSELASGDVGRTFVIDLPVGFDVILVPPLLQSAKAFGFDPKVRINSDRAGDVVTALRYGDTDLALDHMPNDMAGLICEPLFEDRFVVCARKGHPDLIDGLTAESYCSLGHVTLNWTRSPTTSPVDDRLATLGIKRTIMASLPTLAGCASVVAATDLVFTIHRRPAAVLASRFDLQLFGMPIPIEAVAIYQIWHERMRNDPGHNWLRHALKLTVQQLSSHEVLTAP